MVLHVLIYCIQDVKTKLLTNHLCVLAHKSKKAHGSFMCLHILISF